MTEYWSEKKKGKKKITQTNWLSSPKKMLDKAAFNHRTEKQL